MADLPIQIDIFAAFPGVREEDFGFRILAGKELPVDFFEIGPDRIWPPGVSGVSDPAHASAFTAMDHRDMAFQGLFGKIRGKFELGI